MTRVPFSLLLALALSTVAAAEPNPEPDVPAFDLRVGLARSITQPGYLARGVGQGGFVELQRGHVVGALLPISEANDRESSYLELRQALQFTDRFAIADCRARSPKISVWFELESPDELARDPSSVGLWVARGVRVFGLAGARDNAIATVATTLNPGPVTGLTSAGREVVRRILSAGALVDVSNASDPTIDDVIALAREAHSPVVATHANARALADQPRNLSDSQVREIARSGGLVAVTASQGQLAPGRAATLQHLVRQLVYLVGIAGAEHVAVGTGFEAGVSQVRDFQSAADLPRLARALRHAGLRERDLELVMYRNAQRLLCPSAP